MHASDLDYKKVKLTVYIIFQFESRKSDFSVRNKMY